MKESFMNAESVDVINAKINENANITDKKIRISVDLSTQKRMGNKPDDLP